MSGIGWALTCGVGALWCWPLPARPPSRARAVSPPMQLWGPLGVGRRAGDLSSEVFLALLRGIAPAVHAGVPPPVAVAACASVAARATQDEALRRDLVALENAARSGAPLGPCWTQLATRYPHAGLGPVARAWSLSDRVGCGVGAAVAAAVRMTAEQADHRRQIAAATAGARATMQVLTLLPVLGVGICALVGVNPVQLYSSGIGRIALVLGLLMLWIGRRVITVMIRRACAPRALT